LVAPIVTAIAAAWTISGASGATMCTPSTRSLAASTTSFSSTGSSRPLSVCFIGRNRVWKIVRTAWPRARAPRPR
jgi:hypothetical protein